MKSAKHTITFKVIIGYFILAILASTSGLLILYEIKTFTNLQKQDISDSSKIIKTGSLIADIYENESLARAAIQLNSSKKFNEYVLENERLILKIDSLNLIINSDSQKVILDSIKVFVDQKLKNITDLKKLKTRDNSDESINNAINKLTSIDSLLGKVSISDLVNNPKTLDKKTRDNFEEYVRILNKYNPRDSISKMDQEQIDSLVSISKNMLKDVQKKSNNQRRSLQRKERELVENDLIIFRKLQELLSALDSDIVHYTATINKQREDTLKRSENIILFAAAISFIIIIIFSIIFLNDFWKTQRYRKQLEKANETTSSLLKSREQLISMVSHDLRTPLSTIIGFSELLQKSTENKKEKNYIEHIFSASNYMGQLVDDLLEFSKLEHGNIAIERVPFNLEKHINEVVENAKSIIKNKPVTFILEHDSSINKLIITDPFRLKQILYNLVINASKFTNEGSITIASALENNILEIKVTDTGIGISDDQKEHIFNAFTQADNNQDNNHNGFGLGLTISKKLVEFLDGNLTLESELHHGSTFTLSIPVKLSNQDLNTDSKALETPYYNLKALVVEDDASMQLLIRDILKQYHIEVVVFDNAKKALEGIDAITYHFVLTDIQLPKMNGIHFMEILKNHPSYKQQPIIAMTGRANTSTKDYINSGFSEVLIKPFSSSKIQHILKRFFNIEVSTAPKSSKDITEKTEGFNLEALTIFFNHDTVSIKNILNTFLEDTKANYILLETAKKNENIKDFNNVSHKMLTMFKQLKVEAIIPFLEQFESSKIIKNNEFSDFKNELNIFIKNLEKYLS